MLTNSPGPASTQLVLDEYAKINKYTTFFVIGFYAYENPEIVKKAFDAGHQIGIHVSIGNRWGYELQDDFSFTYLTP